MKRLLIFLSVIILGAVAMTAAENADAMLQRAADKLRRAKSVTATFTASAGKSGSSRGTLTLSGDKFRIVADEMSVWYDGRTQWTYSRQAAEVNITEPTPDELAQINPFAIVNSFRRGYKAAVTQRTSTSTVITLTSTARKPEIKRVALTLYNSTLFPSAIVLTMADGSVLKISVSSVKTGNALPASTFTFPKAKHPGVEIVDLR